MTSFPLGLDLLPLSITQPKRATVLPLNRYQAGSYVCFYPALEKACDEPVFFLPLKGTMKTD